MFSPIREQPGIKYRLSSVGGYAREIPYKDGRTLMVSSDGDLYSAVKTDEDYYTKDGKRHTCTALGELIINQRVINLMANLDKEFPLLKVATEYGNIWHLPQKYIDGKSTFVLHDYWDSVIVFISEVS